MANPATGGVGRIVDELRQAYDGDPWHGPPLLKVLEGVDAEVAYARPIADAHTIWEIVAHLAAWDGVVAGRIAERRPIEAPDEGDFPPVTASTPAAWGEALAELGRRHAALVAVVAGGDASRLDETVAGKPYDLELMLHGVAQHMAYHAGQIALLRKLGSAGRSS